MTLTNGNGTTSAILPPGIYVPTVTFFKPTREQELDLETHVQHMTVLAEAGVAGVVLQGSTGEAVTLSRDERIAMVRTAKETFTKVGNNGKIIAGTGGAQSTLDNIRMCEDAASAGADFALVLPPSYYPAWMSDEVIESFYIELADASPIPIIIYSYPAVSSGINMSTDLTIRIGQHRNIAGIKHTDHDVGRIAREAKAIFKTPFTILGGATDYLLGAVAVGGQGAITGMGNVAPRVCCKAFELATKGDVAAAGEFAGEISRAEWALGKGGVVGTKYAAVMANGYDAQAVGCRRPLPSVSSKVKADVDETCAEILKLEARLRDEEYTGAGLGTKRS